MKSLLLTLSSSPWTKWTGWTTWTGWTSPSHLITSSPHHLITSSPHHAITPSPHLLPPRNIDRLAGHVGGFVGGEKGYDVADVFVGAAASQRDLRFIFGADLLDAQALVTGILLVEAL